MYFSQRYICATVPHAPWPQIGLPPYWHDCQGCTDQAPSPHGGAPMQYCPAQRRTFILARCWRGPPGVSLQPAVLCKPSTPEDHIAMCSLLQHLCFRTQHLQITLSSLLPGLF
jgi:hypothetical protein